LLQGSASPLQIWPPVKPSSSYARDSRVLDPGMQVVALEVVAMVALCRPPRLSRPGGVCRPPQPGPGDCKWWRSSSSRTWSDHGLWKIECTMFGQHETVLLS
jgi:hypothetical protein